MQHFIYRAKNISTSNQFICICGDTDKTLFPTLSLKRQVEKQFFNLYRDSCRVNLVLPTCIKQGLATFSIQRANFAITTAKSNLQL